MNPKQQVGVLDCNNFFVSCERLFRPDLRTKPVVVLSSNDGCVVARSQEVKDIGIPMGVPYFKIKDILDLNKVAVFSSHFALYRDISRRVFNLLYSELRDIEEYSIDEAFFLLPVGCDASAEMARIKDTVEQQIGIPVSIGIGSSKTQAKAAVDCAKRSSGVHVWSDVEWQSFTKELKLPQVWGVGAKLELRYKEHGITTVADLLATDPSRIARLYGVSGLRLQQELNGQYIYRLHDGRARQHSVMSSRSFKTSTEQYEVVADAVAYHVRQVAKSLRQLQVGAAELRVSITPSRHGDFVLRGGSQAAVLTAATNDTFALLKVADDLTKAIFEPGVPYKKAGVVALGLQPEPTHQTSLFTASKDNAALLKAMDTINSKTGTETVTVGDRLRGSSWGSRVDVRSPAYTTRWSDIATVNA